MPLGTFPQSQYRDNIRYSVGRIVRHSISGWLQLGLLAGLMSKLLEPKDEPLRTNLIFIFIVERPSDLDTTATVFDAELQLS